MTTIARGGYRNWATALLGALVGVGSGVVILAVAHRLSQALSTWALGAGLIAPLDNWLLPRFVAWASVSLVAGWLIGRAFGRRALLVALLAVMTLILVHSGSMLYLFGDAASIMISAYVFEFLVVALLLPSAAFFFSKRHGA